MKRRGKLRELSPEMPGDELSANVAALNVSRRMKAFDLARSKWDLLSDGEKRMASPEGIESGDARLTDDLSVIASTVQNQMDPNAPAVWEQHLAQFRLHEEPVSALMAIALWPAQPLAPELRRFLQHSFAGLIQAVLSDQPADPREIHNDLLRALGLMRGRGRSSAAISEYRKRYNDAQAEETFSRYLALNQGNREAALQDAQKALGINIRSTLEERLARARRGRKMRNFSE